MKELTAYWAEYSFQQLKIAEGNCDEYGIDHWTKEHQRAVNDLKYYEFMKLEKVRKSTNCSNS